MANYCSINDVNALGAQSPFTQQTTPTQAQVEGFIAQVSLRMDAMLENLGYVTPVVNAPKSLALLREVAAWGVIGLAQQARSTTVVPDQSLGMSVWTKMFLDWFDRLGNPKQPLELPDAQRNAKEIIKPVGEAQDDPMQSSVDSGTTADPTLYLTNPTFTINMKF